MNMFGLSGISKKYKHHTVLSDISFTVEKPCRIALIGDNGVGKTTLLSIIAGITKPDGGAIDFNGEDPLKNRSVFGRYVAYLPQENPLIGELSVKDNLRMWQGHHKIEMTQIMKGLEVDKLFDKRVDMLSGGQRRIVAICCIMNQDQPVLLLDEPTSSLDISYRSLLYDFIDKCVKDGHIVIMSTHDEQEILESDRCLLLKDGRIKDITDHIKDVSDIRYMFKYDNA